MELVSVLFIRYKLDYMRPISLIFFSILPYLTDDTSRSMVYRNPVYHQIVFASLIVITTLRVTYILQLSDASQRIPAKAKKTIIRFFSTGSALFALGFFIWNLDNIFCHTLTTWKVSIGWPVAFLLEGQFLFSLMFLHILSLTLCSVIGHSWWHVLTVRFFSVIRIFSF